MVFNAVHDQVDPAAMLRRARELLVPGGVFLMNEPRMPAAVEDNLDNPMAPFTYTVSTLHCMTVSLAHGGAGLGTGWGEETALRLLEEAGFGPVTIGRHPATPGTPSSRPPHPDFAAARIHTEYLGAMSYVDMPAVRGHRGQAVV